MNNSLESKSFACRNPIFLVGTTRSGTTLLSLMLGQHSEIAFAGEFQWVFDFAGDKEPEKIDEYYAWLQKDRIFQAHRPSIDRSLEFPDLARSFLDQMKQSADDSKPMVTVSVHRHYRQLLTLWPDAKFLYLVRDGRDVAASWIKLGWVGNTWSAARDWVGLLDGWHALKKDLRNDQFFELRLEDLIAQPEHMLNRICEFLGLTYQPEMLEYHKHTSYAAVTTSRSQQWRKKLSADEVRVFEAIAGSRLDQYDYARSGESEITLSKQKQIMLRVQDKFRCIRAKIREFGVRLWFMELVARRTGMERAHHRHLSEMHKITNSKLE